MKYKEIGVMSKKETLHSQIQKYIISQIETGEKKPGDKLPTEFELAQMFNTSRTTVLRALDQLMAHGVIYKKRGSGSYVSDKQNQQNGSRIISLILPFFKNNNFSEDTNENLLIRGCQVYLARHGYMLTISYASENFDEEFKAINQCKDNASIGVILYPSSSINTLADFYSIILDDFPIVFIDNPLICPECNYVLSDNKSGGVIATNHLFEKGCDNFTFACDATLAHYSLQDRYFGFCKSLKLHDYIINKANCFVDCALKSKQNNAAPGDYYIELLKKIMSKPAKKYGIFCTSDILAYEFLEAAKSLQINVPNKLAIVGYGSSAQQLNYQLTTIKQDFYSIGENAARELLKIIDAPKGTKTFGAKYIPVELSQGKTT